MVRINIIPTEADQTWSIMRIAEERTPHGWKDLFHRARHNLQDISDIIVREEDNKQIIYPLKRDVFAAFHYTPLSKVNVVILGQDPYPQLHARRPIPRAVGLSFSVREDDDIPSSLRTIYAELQSTVAGFHTPNHGDLRSWTRQGVLLLNAALTVRAGEPESHQHIWTGFLKQVIEEISKANEQCIYVLWGKKAQNLVDRFLTNQTYVLRASHPSGYSKQGFLGCDHFNKINQMLIAQGKEAIVWQIPYRVINRALPSAQVGRVTLLSNDLPKVSTQIPSANKPLSLSVAHPVSTTFPEDINFDVIDEDEVRPEDKIPEKTSELSVPDKEPEINKIPEDVIEKTPELPPNTMPEIKTPEVIVPPKVAIPKTLPARSPPSSVTSSTLPTVNSTLPAKSTLIPRMTIPKPLARPLSAQPKTSSIPLPPTPGVAPSMPSITFRKSN